MPSMSKLRAPAITLALPCLAALQGPASNSAQRACMAWLVGLGSFEFDSQRLKWTTFNFQERRLLAQKEVRQGNLVPQAENAYLGPPPPPSSSMWLPLHIPVRKGPSDRRPVSLADKVADSGL
ncbi:hypothetical protein B0T19DRAFT_169687 [Cercophora scortea]|uniref:Uncharacterized protein n=1 Tax=Cercophora scortea TaxID=314031 RepID=A0AAE0IMR9_9PEZI|nr:hypothetical protein B0T19DRAFT_169687 [Cercophora scortea]